MYNSFIKNIYTIQYFIKLEKLKYKIKSYFKMNLFRNNFS